MFDRLAASLNIAFKWFPMFDQVQTFSSKILHYKQMLDHLATPSRKACETGKKQPIRSAISRASRYNFRGNTHKAFCGLIYWMFDQTLIARLAT